MEQTKQLTAASALRKAVSVLMALVLAVGLTPITRGQAWAADYKLTIVKNGEGTFTLQTASNERITINDEGEATVANGTYVDVYAYATGSDSFLPTANISVTPSSGNPVSVYESDGVPEFVMPEGNATLTITYPSNSEKQNHQLKTSVGEGGSGIWFLVGDDNEATEATTGTDVGVEVVADKDYEVETVKYNDTDITGTSKGGYYWFTMPDEDVTVTATFKAASSSGGNTGDTWGFYEDAVNMTTPPSASGPAKFSADGEYTPVISGVYMTKNGSYSAENPGGTVTYQVFGSLDGETDEALSNAVECGWNSKDSSFFVPGSGEYDSLTVAKPEQVGDWKMYVKATLTIDGETAATGKSFTWTMTVTDGKHQITLDSSDDSIYSLSTNVENNRAAKDAPVTVIVAKNDGYVFKDDSVKVYYKDAEEQEQVITATRKPFPNDNWYDFTMPDADVTVKAIAAEPEYDVVFDEGITHGTIAVSESSADSLPFTVGDVEEAADYGDFTIGLTVSNVDEGYALDPDSLRVVGDDGKEIDGVSISEDEYGSDDLIISIDYLSFGYYKVYEGENLKVIATFKKTQAITVDKSFTKKFGDEEFNLNATVDSDATPSYTSSNEDVVTVDDTGLVKVVGAGDATITVTAAGSDELFEASEKVDIKVEEAENGLPEASALKADIASVPYSEAATKVTAFNADEIAKANGDVVFVKKSEKSSGKSSKALSVDSVTGEVTVAKSTKPGTYVANIIVMAAGDENHAASYKIVPVSVTVTKASIADAALKLSKSLFTYNKKAQTPKVTNVGNFTFSADDFDVTYSNASSTDVASNYKVTVTAKADSAKFEGTSKAATYKITAATNPVKVTSKAAAKKKPVSIKANKSGVGATVADAQGKVTVANKSSNAVAKKFVLSYSSKKVNVKVPKGTKKGTYEVKIAVTANSDSKNKNYTKVTTKPVSCWVKVG